MTTRSFRHLISRCPCHWVVVYVFHQAGLSWAEIAKRYAAIPFRALLDELHGFYEQERFAQQQMCGIWLRILQKNLNRRVRTLSRNEAFCKRYKSILSKIAAETALQDYFGNCTASGLQRAYEAVDDLIWAAHALEGDPTFGYLIKRYGKSSRRRIRVRVRGDADAEEIYHEIWAEVWRILPDYDPANGSFEAMLKYCEQIVMRRYLVAQKDQPGHLPELVPAYEKAVTAWD